MKGKEETSFLSFGSVQLSAFIVSLTAFQLAASYPRESPFYMFLGFIAALCFSSGSLKGEGFSFSVQRLYLALIISLASAWRHGEAVIYAEAHPLMSKFSEQRCDSYDVRGKVLQVERGRYQGGKSLYVKSDKGDLFVTIPDLPWPPTSLAESGAIVQTAMEVCRKAKNLSALPPWDFNWHVFRTGIRLSGQAREIKILRNPNRPSIADRLIDLTTGKLGDGEGLSLILASDLGRGELISKSSEKLFRETGTTHLLVVSGFHVGVIARAFGAFIVSATRFFPLVFLIVPAPVISATSGFFFALVYGGIIGYSLTVVRALFMLGVISVATIIDRRQHSLRALIVTLIVMLLVWPQCVFEPGCQLTFAALLGLYLGGMLVEVLQNSFLPAGSLEAELGAPSFRLKQRVFKILIAPFVTCSIVSLTTSPVTVLWFQQFVPGAVLINFIFIPLFTVIVVIGGGVGILLTLFSTDLGCVILEISSWLTEKLQEGLIAASKVISFCGLGLKSLSGTGVIAVEIAHIILLLVLICFLKKAGREIYNEDI